MDSEIFSKLVANSIERIGSAAAFKEHRYLFDEISGVGNDFYIGIYGLRGIGKTVMLLQLAGVAKDALYIPIDAKYLANYSIYEIAEEAHDKGYNNLFIDEIHTRKDWRADLKTLYDEGKVHVAFTGSSAANIRKGADLSRRVIMYELMPPSLREFLNIKLGAGIERISMAMLFDQKKRGQIAVKHSRWNAYWQEYYRYGGVLYDTKRGFPKPLMSTLERIISVDLASIRSIDSGTVNDVYKLLYRIAESGPYEISYNSLSSHIGISVKTAIGLVKDLERIGLLKLIYPSNGRFRKEPKVYFRLPFRSALNESINTTTDIGAAREEFFVNNAPINWYVKTKRGEKTPDFVVNEKTIEVGGARKTNYQDADFLAVDGVDFIGNKIPLFLFGFLY